MCWNPWSTHNSCTHLRPIFNVQDMYAYLFVAGAFQDMKNPKIKNMTPCRNGVDASIGTTRRRIPANGTPTPELICDSMMRPEFGIGRDKISPIFPPKRPPTEVATEKTPKSMAVVGCEKPVSSSHMGTKASAAQGKVPATPWATMIWNVRILHTCFASTSMALRPSNMPFKPFSSLSSHQKPCPICQDLQRPYSLSVLCTLGLKYSHSYSFKLWI